MRSSGCSLGRKARHLSLSLRLPHYSRDEQPIFLDSCVFLPSVSCSCESDLQKSHHLII
ncbi:mCG141897 [Mus musculus]|nr:mCG141897 [Mus musculus]